MTGERPTGTAPARSALDLVSGLVEAYAGRTPVETIAVVGNAPVSPDPERATAIDAADLVIRVNGFALDDAHTMRGLGTRADVVVVQWLLEATPWVFQDYRSRLYLYNEPGAMYFDGERLPRWWPADLGLVPVPNREITQPLSRALGFDPAEPRWATTGSVAAYLARTLYPDAHLLLAGFSFVYEPVQTTWDHAYGGNAKLTEDHVLTAEANMLRSFIDEGRAELLA
ncbi:hypothetical protein [Blastococcus atacamensis]|uniref:hypothetical protein n=1 Tax=Blastococcus atacamensis TaxID=2070508 RepID=UPI000CECD329|nr:hypothetical protein [Blastococcus atacamensis]